MLWRKRIPLLLVAILVVAALVYGFLPRPPTVESAAVERGPLAVTVEQEGRTRVQNRYVVTAPVDGYLRRIVLEVGDAVAANDRVAAVEPLAPALLDPRQRAESQQRVEQAEAALRAAQSQVQAALAQAKLARQEAERARNLRRDGFASQQAVDQVEAQQREADAALRAARFNVDVARHELEAARTALRYSAADAAPGTGELVPVRAPVAGKVLALPRKSEGPVRMGAPLLELGDPAELEVAVDVLSMDAVRIRPGQQVILERWGGPDLQGRVRRVEPAGFTKISALGVEEQRVWAIVDITSPPDLWQQLGDGYRVDARFIVWQGNDVLQVPDSALFRHGDGWAVFQLENGRARLRPVQLGHRAGLNVEIIRGLAEGDRVITHPDDRIDDGTRVRDGD